MPCVVGDAGYALATMRMCQGFGLGGEWGGAVLMAVEHAPSNRRGFYGSWPQIGAYVGLLLGPNSHVAAGGRLASPAGQAGAQLGLAAPTAPPPFAL